MSQRNGSNVTCLVTYRRQSQQTTDKWNCVVAESYETKKSTFAVIRSVRQ